MDESGLVGYMLIVIGFLLVVRFKNYFKAVLLALSTPGPTALPLLGNVLLVADSRKLEDLGTNMYQLYGPIVRIWISVVPFFFITEPEHLKVVLSGNQSKKNIFYTGLSNFIGSGLTTTNGQKWKTHRRLLQPSFHNNILKLFHSSFHQHSAELVSRLQELDDTAVNITGVLNKFVVEVLHDTVLGVTAKEDVERSPFRKGKLLLPERIVRPWLLFESVFKWTSGGSTDKQQKLSLESYAKSILDERIRIADSPKTINFLKLMMEVAEDNPDFSEDDIIQEACTFMLAGQDSVGAALAFSLYHIAKHQDVQERIVEELDSILLKSDIGATYEDVCEMKYLEQCIKESLRLCPSLPLLTRQLTEDTSLGKITLPAGTNILFSPFVTHRLPHVFKNPLEYNPERFSGENQGKLHSFAYLAFSSGPRNCIGQKFAIVEMKTLLAQLLRSFHISLAPGKEDLSFFYRISLRARGGVWLRLRKRRATK